jgi:uncharacterized damage-inducible protein DinB
LLAVSLTVTAPAQDKKAAASRAPITGFRADLLRQLDEVGQQLLSLAEATPSEKYAWRPAEGVRSVAEVYAHVAAANFYVPALALNIKSPADVDVASLEKLTEKAQVTEVLKRSLAHLRQAVLQTSERDLDKQIKLFGQDSSVRNAFLTVFAHLHEHLGQSIAYARMNGVVPPWTAAREAEEKRKPQ